MTIPSGACAFSLIRKDGGLRLSNAPGVNVTAKFGVGVSICPEIFRRGGKSSSATRSIQACQWRLASIGQSVLLSVGGSAESVSVGFVGAAAAAAWLSSIANASIVHRYEFTINLNGMGGMAWCRVSSN